MSSDAHHVDKKGSVHGSIHGDSKVQGLKWYSVALLLAGLATIGCHVPFLSNIEDYQNIGSPLVAIDSPIVFDLNLPYVTMATGAVLALLSCGGFAAYSKNKKGPAVVVMLLAFAVGGAQVFAGIRMRQTLDSLLDKLQGTATPDAGFSESETDVLDFISAIFNGCCLPIYDSRNYLVGDEFVQLTSGDGDLIDDNQREVGLCQETVEESCPTDGDDVMFPAIVSLLANTFTTLNDVVCTCITDVDKYESMLDELTQNDNELCNTYRDIGIDDAGDVEVPTVGVSFQTLINLVQQLRTDDYGNASPIERMNIVGKMLPPEQTFQEPPEDVGYSCGIGYAKAVGFVMFLVIDDSVSVNIIASIVLGGFVIAATILLGLMWSIGCGSDVEDDNYFGGFQPEAKVSNELSPAIPAKVEPTQTMPSRSAPEVYSADNKRATNPMQEDELTMDDF